MSAFDRVCRGIGIAVGGSVLSWLVCLGITFIVDDAHHAKASIGTANGGGAGGAWVILPCILCLASVIAGIGSSLP